MTKKKPILSIITVVYNGKEAIIQTIESILKHKSPAVEYIIVDGGSTDGTLDILDRYRDAIDILVSEKDKGIYDAMNKAWDLASGTYLLNINIGDEMIRLPEQEIQEAQKLGLDVLSFPVALSNNCSFEPASGKKLKINNTLHHQGTLYKRLITERYNLKYKVFADFDLNQRLYKHGKKIRIYQNAICKHDVGGISHNKIHFHEVYDIISCNFGSVYKYLAFINFKFLGLKQWIRRK